MLFEVFIKLAVDYVSVKCYNAYEAVYAQVLLSAKLNPLIAARRR